MKKIGAILVFFFSLLHYLQAQTLAFKDDFKLEENDMDALIHFAKIDQNGSKMAIIKMTNPNKGFSFDIGSIGDAIVEEKKGELWVFVPKNTKRITVNHESLGVLRNYELPVEIETGRVYSVTLISGTIKKAEIVEAVPDFIKINSEPSGADIMIDDKPIAGKTPLTNYSITIGDHSITLSKPMYYSRNFKITIKPNEDNKFNFKLLPNFGTLQIQIDKEFENATVYIDEEDKGIVGNVITPIKTGQHALLIKKELYQDYKETINIADGEAKQMRVILKPNFGTIQINSKPADADLYINKELITNKQNAIKKPAGTYFIELKAAHYYSLAKNIIINVNEHYTENLQLTPKIGNIQIITIPDEADVYVNKIKQVRTTPMVLREIQEGNYEIELKKQGYSSIQKMVTVGENATVEIKEILINTKKINISTQPSGEMIIINDKNMGISPLLYEFNLYTTYKIQVLKKGYKNYEQQIKIEENTPNIQIILEKDVKEIFTDLSNTEMVFVQGGTFTMGCTSEQGSDCGSEEKPAHNVTLSSFYIGQYEVTQGLWKKVMGNNPSSFSGCADCPVEQVSWEDCQEFIKKLNSLTGKQFRLPTEAEWEYAARGGNKSRGYKYSGSNDIDAVAWYDGNSGYKTHPVGQKRANELGIYDMSGNVWEWCSDWYDRDYYSSSPEKNTAGASSGLNRVRRGGSWNYIGGSCRVSFRYFSTPSRRINFLGLRLVVVL